MRGPQDLPKDSIKSDQVPNFVAPEHDNDVAEALGALVYADLSHRRASEE